MIILITGTPCVGKSTIGKILAEKIEAEIINLKQIAKKHKIAKKKENTVVIDELKIKNIFEKEIDEKRSYIIPSHLAQYVSPKITDYCFVLRCNPKILEKRLKKRDYDEEKIKQNVLCENLDSCLIESIEQGHKKHLYEIDTTNKKPKMVAEEILKIIRENKKSSFGDVKWTDWKI